MERNQEMRHICRFCDKSFSCGRALGGHMRSHLTTNQAESSDKLSKKKPSSRFINDDEKEAQAAAQNGYSLREKPKKTNKFDDLVEDSSFDHMNKVCKECGKKFLVWKSFFCHMKCHSDNNNTSMSVEVEDDEYWNTADNEEEVAPIRKQRSRIIKRYKDATITTTTTTTTTSYLQNNNASSSCVSEIDQEQEEVALSLILLSRDVTERSNAEFLEARITSQQPTLSDSKSEIKNLKYCNDSEFLKSKEVKTAKVEALSLDSGCSNTKLKQYEYKDTLISRNGAQVQGNGMIEKAKMEEGKKIQLQGSELEIKKQKANKRKRNAMEKSDYPTTCFVESSEKIRSKFECTFCNKIFDSYQALGGHRASHKKMKSGCFSSKIDSNENSTETEISPNIQSTEKINSVSKIKNSDYGSKKNSDKVHQCPVCFKVFPSGQALGGHKRSHMLAEIKSNNNNKNLSEKAKDLENVEKIPGIRDFLDLNLPAPSEQDEVAESSDRGYCNPWWMGLGSNITATGGFANALIPETMIQ